MAQKGGGWHQKIVEGVIYIYPFPALKPPALAPIVASLRGPDSCFLGSPRVAMLGYPKEQGGWWGDHPPPPRSLPMWREASVSHYVVLPRSRHGACLDPAVLWVVHNFVLAILHWWCMLMMYTVHATRTEDTMQDTTIMSDTTTTTDRAPIYVNPFQLRDILQSYADVVNRYDWDREEKRTYPCVASDSVLDCATFALLQPLERVAVALYSCGSLVAHTTRRADMIANNYRDLTWYVLNWNNIPTHHAAQWEPATLEEVRTYFNA